LDKATDTAANDFRVRCLDERYHGDLLRRGGGSVKVGQVRQIEAGQVPERKQKVVAGDVGLVRDKASRVGWKVWQVRQIRAGQVPERKRKVVAGDVGLIRDKASRVGGEMGRSGWDDEGSGSNSQVTGNQNPSFGGNFCSSG
jgi:hypothetical protein